jgi:hypothetical protein
MFFKIKKFLSSDGCMNGGFGLLGELIRDTMFQINAAQILFYSTYDIVNLYRLFMIWAISIVLQTLLTLMLSDFLCLGRSEINIEKSVCKS